MLLDALVEDFSDKGYIVIGCASAEIAFENMKVELPDIILTDLVLPNIDGFEVIRYVKSNNQFSGIKVLVLSNSSELRNIEKAEELGASGFLVKAEMSLKEILKRVEEEFEK